MAKGISLHIGLKYFDEQVYYGNDGFLHSAVYDAEYMDSIFKKTGFKTQLLTFEGGNLPQSNMPVRENIKALITNAADKLCNGDVFCVSYSGHGGRILKNSNTPQDGYYETWCLYDGHLLDIELTKIWSLFKEGVRVLVISDSCQSGGIVDKSNKAFARKYKSKALSDEISTAVFENQRDLYSKAISESKLDTALNCHVKLLSACMEDEVTHDGENNSEFTGALKEIWANGSFTGFYETLHQKLFDRFHPRQNPCLINIGKQIPLFNNQKPFKI